MRNAVGACKWWPYRACRKRGKMSRRSRGGAGLECWRFLPSPAVFRTDPPWLKTKRTREEKRNNYKINRRCCWQVKRGEDCLGCSFFIYIFSLLDLALSLFACTFA